MVLKEYPDCVKSNCAPMQKTKLITIAIVVGGIALFLGVMGALSYQRYLETTGPVMSINSVDQFEREVLKSDLPVFVYFYGKNCKACQKERPLIEQAAGDYAGKVKFVKVDVYRVPQIPTAIGVTKIPTMLVIKVKDETIVGAVGYLEAADLKKLIDQGIAAQPTPDDGGPGQAAPPAQPAAPANPSKKPSKV